MLLLVFSRDAGVDSHPEIGQDDDEADEKAPGRHGDGQALGRTVHDVLAVQALVAARHLLRAHAGDEHHDGVAEQDGEDRCRVGDETVGREHQEEAYDGEAQHDDVAAIALEGKADVAREAPE